MQLRRFGHQVLYNFQLSHKWLLSKALPKVYGNKLMHEDSVTTTVVSVRDDFAD
jgi:hypothetical protein